MAAGAKYTLKPFVTKVLHNQLLSDQIIAKHKRGVNKTQRSIKSQN